MKININSYFIISALYTQNIRRYSAQIIKHFTIYQISSAYNLINLVGNEQLLESRRNVDGSEWNVQVADEQDELKMRKFGKPFSRGKQGVRLMSSGKRVVPLQSSEVLTITPLGAGNEVGRSCIVLSYKGKNVMLDCGIHPAYNGIAALPFFDEIDPASIDLILVTQ